MSTIRDIAKACNVSITTVSNILNGNGSPSELTKQKVLKAAEELKYVPNFMAKNLKQKSTRLIGVIAEDLTVFNCPEIIDGINEYADEKGYTFLLGNLRLYKKYGNDFYRDEFHNYEKQVEEEFQIMTSKNVDGIIYVCAHSRKIASIPKESKVPIVIAYGYTEYEGVSSVLFNDEQGAYDITSYLIRKGHRLIGTITGDLRSIHTTSRLKGFQRALFENEILFNPDFVVNGLWKKEESKIQVNKLIESGVTGIFAMNDVMAVGVYDYAYDNNLMIGKDLDVVGFDNQEIASVIKPVLPTVSLPLHQIGRKACQILINQIEGVDMHFEKVYKLPCEIVLHEKKLE